MFENWFKGHQFVHQYSIPEPNPVIRTLFCVYRLMCQPSLYYLSYYFDAQNMRAERNGCFVSAYGRHFVLCSLIESEAAVTDM